MFKWTTTYKDWDGKNRTEDFYFNLTQTEVAKMELSVKGGLSAVMKRITESEDLPKLIEIWQDFLKLSYGVKDADGRRFRKGDELFKDFEETPAYDQLFMKLATDAEFASTFMKEVIPSAEEMVTPQITQTQV